MDEDIIQFREKLIQLQMLLRDFTKSKFGRINPFIEDLFDWKERGEYWCGPGKNVTIYNTTTILGDVSIGAETWIGPYCTLDGSGVLTIGDYCSISTGVQIFSHDTVKWALSGGRIKREVSPIKIGNCCFIGTQAIITRGVTIGDYCLIGAGAVVTHDIPSYSVAAGVPAKVIGRVIFDNPHQVTFKYFNHIDESSSL